MRGSRTRACIEALEERNLLAACGQEVTVYDGTAAVPVVAAMPDGGSVVVWRGGVIGGDWNVYARRYDAKGEPIGGMRTVASPSNGQPGYPDVATAADGHFIVSWTKSDGIHARLFDSFGMPEWTELCLDGNGSDEAPSIAMAPDGHFAIAYRRYDGNAYRVYTKLFDATGAAVTGELQVGWCSGDRGPAIAMAPTGAEVVAWSNQSKAFAQMLDSAGQPDGSAIQLNSPSTSGYEPSVTMDVAGNWTAAWGAGNSIYARRYSANGQPLDAAEFSVDNREGSNGDWWISAAMIPDGGFYASWTAGDYVSSSVYGRRFGPDGTAMGPSFVIGSGFSAENYFSDIAVGPQGELIAAWRAGDLNFGGPVHMVRYGSELKAISGGPYGIAEGDTLTLVGSADWSPGGAPANQYQWDLDYDGNTFDVDAIGIAPRFTAPVVTVSTTRTIALRVVASDGEVSAPATTTITIGPWQPHISAGGPYRVGEGQQVKLADDVSTSQYSHEWDFNYDGKNFDVDATEQNPSFSAAGMVVGDSRTIAMRLITPAGVTSDAVTATVNVVNNPPAAKLSSSNFVPVGSSGRITFTNVQDCAADLKAGMHYSYDFNNDGRFEVANTTAASYVVPASYLTVPGRHTIKARIKDRTSAFTDYTTSITVNPPANWQPYTPGLTWKYAGTDDGSAATWTLSSAKSSWNGRPTVRAHRVETGNSAEVSDGYYVVSGNQEWLLHQHSVDADSISEVDVPAMLPSGDYGHGAGWSTSWSDVRLDISIRYPTDGDVVTGRAWDSGSMRVVGFQPVTLSSGVYFSQAMVVRTSTTQRYRLSTSTFYIDGTDTTVETTWYVKGIGLVKDQETETDAWRGSDGSTDTKHHGKTVELSSIPSWANFTFLDSGTLYVYGTAAADSITFSTSGDTLTAYRNGVPNRVALSGLKKVVVYGSDGNDTLDARGCRLPVSLDGGAGADKLFGGPADAVLSGGAGNDVLRGGAGNDTLIAGSGHDTLYGGDGDDLIKSKPGLPRDLIDAGAGHNSILRA